LIPALLFHHSYSVGVSLTRLGPARIVYEKTRITNHSTERATVIYSTRPKNGAEPISETSARNHRRSEKKGHPMTYIDWFLQIYTTVGRRCADVRRTGNRSETSPKQWVLLLSTFEFRSLALRRMIFKGVGDEDIDKRLHADLVQTSSNAVFSSNFEKM